MDAIAERVGKLEVALSNAATTIDAAHTTALANKTSLEAVSKTLEELKLSIALAGGDIKAATANIDALKKTADAQSAEIKAFKKPDDNVAAPLNMNLVGDVLVDRYETSMWTRADKKAVECKVVQAALNAALADGGTIDTIYAGKAGTYCKGKPAAAICKFQQHGADPTCLGGGDTKCNDYPSYFTRSSAALGLVYACPIKGVRPSAHMTWFQAAVSCAASGKHLLDNATWQLAALGTPEGIGSTVAGLCNMNSGKVRATGEGANCKSAFGVFDMVGNLDEWVADWMPGGAAWMGTQQMGMKLGWSSYGDGDFSMNVNSSAYSNETNSYVEGMLCTPFRGGFYKSGPSAGPYAMNLRNGPTDWGQIHGHRCAKRSNSRRRGSL
jgi:hypothetical protein